MSKDLKNLIDGIESSEKQTAVLQSKIDRLNEFVEKQNKVIRDHEDIIEEQKTKISRMYDIPDDVLELKELIVTQRALINDKERELEMSKGNVVEAQREMDYAKKQNIPTQRKLEESLELIGNLKAELAEKNSEILLKNETIKSLENKVQELQAFADKLQDEQVKLLSNMDQKWKTEIETIKNEHFEEKKELTAKIAELDKFLLDFKLVSTEATSEAKDVKSRFEEIHQKYDDLINKVEQLRDEKREAEKKIRQLQEKVDEVEKFKDKNMKKIFYFDKLTQLMEKEAQFKAFLIVEKVGSISIDDLRGALGSPIVLVKKIVQNLQNADLFEIDDNDKISVKIAETS
jgi:chromosome segregation ATPase